LILESSCFHSCDVYLALIRAFLGAHETSWFGGFRLFSDEGVAKYDASVLEITLVRSLSGARVPLRHPEFGYDGCDAVRHGLDG